MSPIQTVGTSLVALDDLSSLCGTEGSELVAGLQVGTDILDIASIDEGMILRTVDTRSMFGLLFLEVPSFDGVDMFGSTLLRS